MTKPISFRPTLKISKYVDSQQQKHPKKKPSHIIIEILELAISRSGQEGKPSLPTGIIIECPLRLTTVPICPSCNQCLNVVYMKQQVDSSVCKTCSKYPCETWETILSEKRCFPKKLLTRK